MQYARLQLRKDIPMSGISAAVDEPQRVRAQKLMSGVEVMRELRELRQQHGSLVAEHAAVTADRDRLRARGLVLAAEYGELERWEAAIKDQPDPYEVLWHSGPFAGFTPSKAWAVQDALCGYEVLVQGRYSEQRGIFHRILMPCDFVTTPFCQCYDLEIATDWHGRKCGLSTTRHLSFGAVKRLEVIGPEYGFCADCCRWVPKEDLMDLVEEGRHRICCRSMDHDGACR
jgi:hypothetical protein